MVEKQLTDLLNIFEIIRRKASFIFTENSFYLFLLPENMVAVAQLVRALVCGTGGRGFETPQPPHSFTITAR